MGDLWHYIKDFTGIVLLTVGRAICGIGMALVCEDIRTQIAADARKSAQRI